MTLHDLAIQIEEDTFNRNYQPSKVHFWVPFDILKCIYPLHTHKFAMSMQHVDQQHNDRWVEIPNDFEDVSIHDFAQMMLRSTKNGELEIGVEIYDEINEKW